MENMIVNQNIIVYFLLEKYEPALKGRINEDVKEEASNS
jgi:hypothetical protein